MGETGGRFPFSLPVTWESELSHLATSVLVHPDECLFNKQGTYYLVPNKSFSGVQVCRHCFLEQSRVQVGFLLSTLHTAITLLYGVVMKPSNPFVDVWFAMNEVVKFKSYKMMAKYTQ